MKFLIVTSLLLLVSCVPKAGVNKKVSKSATCTKNCSPPLALEKECDIPNDLTERSYQKLLQDKSYSSCINSCKDSVSIILLNNQCVHKTQTKACVNQPANSTGGYLQSEDGGVTFSECIHFECKTGYELKNNQCQVIQTTPVIQSRACTPQPANSQSGKQTSLDNGATWSICQDFICNQGFVLNNNSCVSTTKTRSCINQPENSSGGLETSLDQGLTWSSCDQFTCNYGYEKSGIKCNKITLTRACNPQPDKSSGGYQESLDMGISWSLCKSFGCTIGYAPGTGLCIQKTFTRNCQNQPVNSTGGSETSNDYGATYGSCSGFTCNNGFTLQNSSCVNSNITRACSPQPTGTSGGVQNSTNAGLTWSDCINYTCATGYQLILNTCQKSYWTRACNPQPPNSTGGYQETQDAGLNFSDCKSFSCLSGYSLVNGQCSINGETPNYDINSYLEKFTTLAKKYNRDFLDITDVTLDSTLPSGTLGICAYAKKRYIRVNLAWWSSLSTSNANREYVILHEMGHCALDRGHSTNTVDMADYKTMIAPTSMMYPSIMSANVYTNNITYYQHELMDETLATQNVAIYLYGNNTSNISAFALSLPYQYSTTTTNKNGEIICTDQRDL